MLISQSYNQFAFNLYKKLNKKNDNVFMSPFSIVSALSMCYTGARNNTENQLKELLNYSNSSNEDIHKANANLFNHLISIQQNGVELNVANKIYPSQAYNVNDEFIHLLKLFYQSEVECIDYSNAKQSADTINQWVEKQTNRKINDLIDENSINDLVRLILVNAIYFKGNWLNKFDNKQTTKETFYLSNGTAKQVDMMQLLNKKFNLKVNPLELNAKVCEIPYVGEHISMTIILPNEGVKLCEIESKLNGNFMESLSELGDFKMKVHLYLPKFKFEKSMDLANTLKSMGASDAFDQKSDFSGITNDINGLYISKVIHKAIVEVNEDGTEAAAATAVIIMKRCTVMEQLPEEFRCNRPFIFIIHENNYKTILFIGKYENPV